MIGKYDFDRNAANNVSMNSAAPVKGVRESASDAPSKWGKAETDGRLTSFEKLFQLANKFLSQLLFRSIVGQ